MTAGSWWQTGVIYQIYPRSFQDSDGDGVGDLPGIIARLDYFAWLGIDAIWLSPIFRSPMADFGYDVADYRDVDPLFGTLTDLDRLVSEAHVRGIRVILDFVPNHTSDRHPWFVESRSSRDDPRRDWYLWADPRPDGGPPNEWSSMFGGSAWAWDAPTGQYYYHGFLAEQPDLNWRNPQVAEAMLDTLRFWMDRGVDGFRIDVLWLLLKDEQWQMDPAASWAFREDLPGIQDIVAGMRAASDRYDDRVLIGEIYLPVDRLMTYYGTAQRPGIHLPFNFGLVRLPWKATEIRTAIERYEAALPAGAWPNWVLGNHDQPRIASRVGAAQARVAAMLLLTLRGTPTLYYGDEIGLPDVEVPPERRVDPASPSRDPERSPMAWDGDEVNAGFSDGEPWLPMVDPRSGVDVAAQRDVATSMLTLHRRLLMFRRREPAISAGTIELEPAPAGVLRYRRSMSGRSFTVLLGLGDEPVTVDDPTLRGSRIVLSTGLDREGERVTAAVSLAEAEGIVLEPDR